MKEKLQALVIDDDEFSRAILTRAIVMYNPASKITTLGNVRAAQDLIYLNGKSRGGVGFDLIISDLDLLGNISGLDLWEQCRIEMPNAKFLLVSGKPLDQFLKMVGEREALPTYLPKPIRLEQCKDVIERLFQFES